MRSGWIGSHSLQASGYHPFLCLPSRTHTCSGEGERMAIAIVSVPTPHQTLCTQRSYTKGNSWFHSSTTTLIKYPSKPTIIPICSSSTSSTSVVEDGPPPPSSDALPATEDVDKLPLSGCKGCGREEIEKGCNGEGRIQGGIATVPGFGWWPIKAYRPCPGFLASGGRYRRQGQSMDEVAFGREQKETTRNQ